MENGFVAALIPPPPLPDASTGVGLWQIGFVMLLVVGALGLIVFAIKPMFTRQPVEGMALADVGGADMSILSAPVKVEMPAPAPVVAPVAPAEPEETVVDEQPAIGRLRRLAGDDLAGRRRLGALQASKMAEDVVVAEEPAVEPEPIPEPVNDPFWDWDAEPEPVVAAADAEPVTDIGEAIEAVETDMVVDPYMDILQGVLLPFSSPRDAISLQMAEGVDRATADGVLATLRELVFSANSGKLLNGFALYSDGLLFKTMDESGMTEDEFRETYENIPARPREDWLEVASLTDITRLENGKVTAIATLADRNGNPLPGSERYRFVQDARSGMWQIDEIEVI